jgi:hypothetical protein
MTQSRNPLCAIVIASMLTLMSCSSISPDEKFIGTVRSSRLDTQGLSDTQLIGLAHSVCGLLGSGVHEDMSSQPDLTERQRSQVFLDAAEDTYCPAFKGK